MLRQLNDRTQQFESEKSTLIMDYQRRLDDVQRDRTTELENLRSLQRFVLPALISSIARVAFLFADRLWSTSDENTIRPFNV